MKLNTWQKNVLSAVVIAAGGFILFNAAFLLAALVINGLGMLMGNVDRPPSFIQIVAYAGILLIISWLVFRSKLSHLIKATYMTMPLMVVLVMTGITLYTQPQWVPICVGAVIVAAVLLFIYIKKLPWLYYFATVYVAALALCPGGRRGIRSL